MSVIIRLQNLPWSANALDIRQYFAGLSIPEGGVHIVGGELGDAFIAFSTDEDARQAFMRNNGKLKEVQITLLLSSRTEMQKVIEAARNPLAAFLQAQPPAAPLVPTNVVPTAAGPPPPPQPQTIKPDDRRDSKDKDRRDSRDSKRRSRSKSKSRERRSRDRDRRDNRRRDRSRSRDRRDRRRDRRSRSRDRARSRDRDRKSKDRKRDDSKRDDGNKSDNEVRWELKNDNLPNPIQGQPLLGLLQQQHLQNNQRINAPGLNIAQNLQTPNPWALNIRNIAASIVAPVIESPPQIPFQNQNNQGSPNQIGNNRLGFHQNMDSNMDQKPNPFAAAQLSPLSRMQSNFPNNMDNNRFNNGPFNGPPNGPPPNGHFQPPNNNRQSNERPDNRMGFNRPPMGGQFNNGPMGNFNNFNNNQNIQNQEQNQGQKWRFDFNKNCCVSLRPFYGGYGGVRRYFNGAFINNTGLKFVSDENGKKTGVVFVRFVYPEGKQLALQRNGGMLQGVQVEVKHLDDIEFDAFVEKKPIFNPMQQSQNENLHSSPFFRALQNFSCLTLEKVPPFAKEHHIMKLFPEYPLNSIIVVRIRTLQEPIPTAYVKFTKCEDAKRALKECPHSVEGIPVIMRPCSMEEFDEVNVQYKSGQTIIEVKNKTKLEEIEESSAVEIKKEPDDSKPGCVFISGLPFKTTENTILDFFSDIGVVPDRIHLRPHGECYCEFKEPRAAERALEKNNTNLGLSIITVESVSKDEMEDVLSNNPHPNQNFQSQPRFNNFNNNNRGGMRQPPGGPSMGFRNNGPPRRPAQIGLVPGCSVALSNVPYSATKEEIAEFFEEFDVSAANVLRRNDNGKPTGDAMVTFSSPAEAQRAIREYNHATIRDRTIFLSVAQGPGPGGMKVPSYDRNNYDM